MKFSSASAFLPGFLHFIICFFFLAPLSAQDVPSSFFLSQSLGREYAVGTFEYLVNPSYNWKSLEKIPNEEWVSVASESMDLGFQTQPIWFRFSVENKDPEFNIYVLNFRSCQINRITANNVSLKNDGDFQTAGDLVPKKEHPLVGCQPSFRFPLAPYEKKIIYAKMETDSLIQFPIRFFTLDGYYLNRLLRNQVQWSILFLISIVILYGMLLIYFTRKIFYLYAILEIFSLGFYFWVGFGNSYELLWPESPYLQNQLLKSSLWAILIFQLLFLRNFPSNSHFKGSFGRILNSALALSYVCLVASFFIKDFQWNLILYFYVSLAANLLNFVCGFYLYKKGYSRIFYLLLSWTLFFVFHTVHFLNQLGYLPFGLVSINGLLFYIPFHYALLWFACPDYFYISVNSEVLNIGRKEIPIDLDAIRKDQPKHYKKTNLKEIDQDDLLHKLKEIMEVRKPYLEEDFRLEDLASLLKIAPFRLTEFFSTVLNTNFVSYTHEWRIEHCKAEIAKFPEKNLLTIAFESGFSSKSTFHEAFKKQTKMTPGQYRKSGKRQ
ncbi:helix-turn-helix domain-containing protein [Leptospira idonii]|uniref:Helix-turn-helix domain-containing protein n=1 Tax=Leptospira idonii TaxID=1193500 RepID=A0A4R9LWE8_9LEPT|nr:helix-turn-helix domain-containing protein [Leptospira idonii]TGN17277.1 helix-turn-helix domain-containing protein [Leptospira idonii]